MPLKSRAQYRKLQSIDPAMAERWKAETPHFHKLPEHVAKSKKEVTPKPKGGGGIFASMRKL